MTQMVGWRFYSPRFVLPRFLSRPRGVLPVKPCFKRSFSAASERVSASAYNIATVLAGDGHVSKRSPSPSGLWRSPTEQLAMCVARVDGAVAGQAFRAPLVEAVGYRGGRGTVWRHLVFERQGARWPAIATARTAANGSGAAALSLRGLRRRCQVL